MGEAYKFRNRIFYFELEMAATINTKFDERKEHLKKLEAIRTYYELVKKGRPPEQTRKDLGLSFHDIEGFDFSVFKEAV